MKCVKLTYPNGQYKIVRVTDQEAVILVSKSSGMACYVTKSVWKKEVRNAQ